MAYSQKQIDEIFEKILLEISIKGRPLRRILKDEGMPTNETFYTWLEKDPEKSKRYARSAAIRADILFDEILEIADDKSGDIESTEFGDRFNSEFAQRSRIRIDARKWVIAKMNPKKYGTNIELDEGDSKVVQITFKGE